MQRKRFALGLPIAAVTNCLRAFSKPLQCGLCLLPAISVLLLQDAFAGIPTDISIQTPATGDHALHILSPNLLELVLVNTKQPDPAHVNSWDWVNGQQSFVPPDMSSVKVIVNGQ